ncbi:DUF86 domain-containing protein [Aquibacillus sp. 3ASR75-11]|uniref:DUF86 domain-containing protein n=1 Tax=Terrihalobacillus insolitus TaxID=2950438 RepID=A0A9X4ALZ5_9BACI|nr:DUF86 domain-containing protein [Terrihalobacillus insolitus]MDC3412314.1 DUF86 domain-containing protein [Terrihalobacillus insolitus]MDC3422993.1 DUF86 domain-containing protein [Terrihalobacillus insolitus]
MDQDLVMNKTLIIERCLRRMEEEYQGKRENLTNFTKQDSIILNLQRCCEAAIDLAMHVCRAKQLGVPQTSRESFEMLVNNNLLSNSIVKNMKSMVGFRNIAIHDYQQLNLDVLETILNDHLDDFKKYVQEVKQI